MHGAILRGRNRRGGASCRPEGGRGGIAVPPNFAEAGKGKGKGKGTSSSERLLLDPRALGDFCTKHDIKVLSLFGSALTDQFDSRSDVDVMFESEGASPGFFEQMAMTDDLEAVFGRPVDLVSRRAIEESTNPVRKRAILEGARVIFAR